MSIVITHNATATTFNNAAIITDESGNDNDAFQYEIDGTTYIDFTNAGQNVAIPERLNNYVPGSPKGGSDFWAKTEGNNETEHTIYNTQLTPEEITQNRKYFSRPYLYLGSAKKLMKHQNGKLLVYRAQQILTVFLAFDFRVIDNNIHYFTFF